MKKILLLSPHPDDIELSMGGNLFKLAKNYITHVYLFNNCDIKDEFKQSMNLLNSDYYIDRSCKLRYFYKDRQLILNRLFNLKVQFQPDIVFCPSLDDTHQDHKVIAEEAYRAFKNTTLISYIHPQNCRDIRPNYFVELSESEINKKIELLSVYKSQQHRNYFSKEAITGTAAFYGAMTGRKYCEAFEALRMFE